MRPLSALAPASSAASSTQCRGCFTPSSLYWTWWRRGTQGSRRLYFRFLRYSNFSKIICRKLAENYYFFQCRQDDIAGLYRIYHKDNARTRDESFRANDRMLRACAEAAMTSSEGEKVDFETCRLESTQQAACPAFPHNLVKSTRIHMEQVMNSTQNVETLKSEINLIWGKRENP